VCAFVVGATTQQQRADRVFALPERDDTIAAIAPLLVAEGVPAPMTECVAAGIVDNGEVRLVVHELLGVQSPALAALRAAQLRDCRGG
ncbi:MAG TPA: hypothetical protein PLV68_15400, partial [Ilumatobacteraceae bacterium]|nr:hypothetical protein [Ilumatobacteraceae bacterium]